MSSPITPQVIDKKHPMPPVSGQPHPDVLVVQEALAKLQPGENVPAGPIARKIGLDPKDDTFYRRAKTARDRLRRDGINVVAVPGEGFLRETAEQTLARHIGRERRVRSNDILQEYFGGEDV